MTRSTDLREQLRARYATQSTTGVVTPPAVDLDRAFAVTANSGRTIITAPIREVAQDNDKSFTYLRGRLVGADTPNGNGALWTTEDLELGAPSVAHGPLNWLHDDTHIIGALTSGQLVAGREAAAAGVGNHIVSDAVIWSFLFGQEARTVERAAANGQLFYSMECISREVACVGDSGCGLSFGYGQVQEGNCCNHLREKSSIRRFVDPIFQGAAVIVPPVKPGWAHASVDVARAEQLREAASLDAGNMTSSDALDLATAVLAWANRS